MFDFTKIAEQIAAWEQRIALLEQAINQIGSLVVNVGGMVQQIHTATVVAPAAAAPTDTAGKVVSALETVSQIVGEVGAVAHALAPAAAEPAPATVASPTHG